MKRLASLARRNHRAACALALILAGAFGCEGADEESEVTRPADTLELSEDNDWDGASDAPENDAHTLLQLGERCEAGAGCAGGYCLPIGQEQPTCTQLCLQDCPSGWQCEERRLTLNYTMPVCVPEHAEMCTACTEEDGCIWGACAHLPDGDACLEVCTNGYICPAGSACQPLEGGGSEVEYCVPFGGLCGCTYVNAGSSRPCYRASGWGTCTGQEVCVPPLGFIGCTALWPSADVCDGLDNDCDGTVDPGLDCDDGNPCTSDDCDSGRCASLHVDGLECSDSDLCTGTDTCQEGVCVGLPLPLCRCGNGVCGEGEDDTNCPGDCGWCGDGLCGTEENLVLDCPTDCGGCGDGVCTFNEGYQQCPLDCGWCGDGVCGITEGTDHGSCDRDCLAACGDKTCEGGESVTTCLVDCGGCGDGFCGLNETPVVCFQDCKPGCGNGTCDVGEDVLACAVDCMPTCGDADCSYPENPYNCPVDCTVCGDGTCGSKESVASCPSDCALLCGDGLCQGSESPNECPFDCGWCGDGVCASVETGTSCPLDCSPACGDLFCSVFESEDTCPMDCVGDPDLDGIITIYDTCPYKWNPDQMDSDKDGKGDICDSDDDGDGYNDIFDCAPTQSLVYPGAMDECNGIDDNCDGSIDEMASCPGIQEQCLLGVCTCIPACLGRNCGANGCGGQCGICNGTCLQNGVCVEGLQWVVIPGGDFTMGCSENDPDCQPSELPRHLVHIPAFKLLATEVTSAQFAQVLGYDTSFNAGGVGGANYPADGMTWEQAAAFCAGIQGQLPSESEWEYAARGGSSSRYVCGNTVECLAQHGWFSGETATKRPVATKAPNAFGLYDMFGNVSEYTADCWHQTYDSAPNNASPWDQDCAGSISDGAAARGGSFIDSSFRVSERFPDNISGYGGFRCAAKCVPDCTEKLCGDDGCGGTCGFCLGVNEECLGGGCVCAPLCSGRNCGDDGCGGTCGTCDGICSVDGHCMKGAAWLVIPEGTGWMGCDSNKYSCSTMSQPFHQVSLAGFRMLETEVTENQFLLLTGMNPSDHNGTPVSIHSPVDKVTWDEANSFCLAIGGRLPTESEWEYAARAGSLAEYLCDGESGCPEDFVCPQNGNGVKCESKSYFPNSFGLYGMMGNVKEWVSDCTHLDYQGAPADGSSWNEGCESLTMVVRGGCVKDGPDAVRLWQRDAGSPSARDPGQGFRCVADGVE